MTINALIVDDESHCRSNIRHSLETFNNWQVVGELSNATMLVEEALNLHADVVFLDINMPNISGIDAARKLLNANINVIIIFVTAYDQHALEAFEVCAVDYILKPFDSQRITQSIERIEKRLKTEGKEQDGVSVLIKNEYLNRIVIKSTNSVLVFPTVDVRYLLSCGNYVEVFHEEGKHLQRASLQYFETYLDPTVFCRIHRQCIVRMSLIKALLTCEEGKHKILLKSGEQLSVGESYKPLLIKRWAE